MINSLRPTPSEHDDQGSVERSAGPGFLVIGEVLKPHGVKGELKVFPHTELPERFLWLKNVYVGREEPRPVAVESVRFHKQAILLKLVGCDGRSEAEAFRGQLLQVPEEEAIPLEEGEYFLYQLEGLAVYGDDGRLLGRLTAVIETKANNVFVVEGELGEILLPDIVEVVRDIDFVNGRMTVSLLPGLLP